MKRVAILLTTLTLSVGIAYAGGVVTSQNFHEMYNAGTMTVNTSTKTAVTDFVTYTYSGTYSRFNYDGTITNGRIGLQLYGSGAKVVTSTIEELESVTVQYFAFSAKMRMKVYYSADSGSSWTQLEITSDEIGSTTYDMPAKGDYMLKIERWDDIWLEQIDYVTAPPCNCLRVTVTE